MIGSQPPGPGEIVEVRQRQWMVGGIAPGALPADGLHPTVPPQHLLSLSSIEDDALGAFPVTVSYLLPAGLE